MLQQRMEDMRRQGESHDLPVPDARRCAQYAVWDRGWRYKPRKKRGTTLKRLENYWECGKAIHYSAMTRSRHLQAGRCHKQAAAHRPR
ncbi:hypothetical protein E2C01_028061 [Portunus trituberculatus]|uniref:Uncharacterized protein n=1 Tax=Portunus trituberculatus TaxID=210409 RepID=A0A5B7EN80_PORTR|nr:hypothetical protein [Portunus trituberculatus]